MEFRWIWCNVMSNEYKRIQVSSSGYVDICWTKPGCNMEIGRGCSDWCRCNFPVPSLRLLRPLANGNSHQQLSKPQSSNFKAEQSQMIMKKSPNSRIWQKESKTPNSMKKWTSSWKRQSIASHLTCMSDGEVVMGLGGQTWVMAPKSWMDTIQKQMWLVRLFCLSHPHLPIPKNWQVCCWYSLTAGKIFPLLWTI